MECGPSESVTYAVIGAAQRVHSTLAPGFPESVYHQALLHEFSHCNIRFGSEKKYQVSYHDRPCGEFRIDILVEDNLILEIKAAESLMHGHTVQCVSYLRAAQLPLALLLNFGESSLKAKRVAL